MENFKILIASPFDREELVSEIWYENDFLAEINQENEFLEIVFYHGNQKQITFLFGEFMEILQKAKICLVGDVNGEIPQSKKPLFETVKMEYVNHCKISILKQVGKNKAVADISYNDELVAEIDQEENLLRVTLYYHDKNIEVPIEGLQEILQRAKELLVESTNE